MIVQRRKIERPTNALGNRGAHDNELRSRVRDQLAAALERERVRLLDILTLENGKVRMEAAFKIDMVPIKLRYSTATALLEIGRAVTPHRKTIMPPQKSTA